MISFALRCFAFVVVSMTATTAFAQSSDTSFALNQGDKNSDRAGESTSATADWSYTQGLRAYLSEDYAKAQQLWLLAARAKHALALFNLGLLHEQAKVEDANAVAANNWFELAGRAGYAAAYHHMAMRRLDRNPSDVAGLAYLERAAQQGYAPSSARLAQQVDAAMLAQVKPRQPSITPTLKDIKWIATQDASHWTIQLLAFSERAAVYTFFEQHQLQASAAYFQDTYTTPSLYKILFGVYPTKEQATIALRSLPPELAVHQPWLRSFASVQATLRQAE